MFDEGKYFGTLTEAVTGEARSGNLQVVLTFNVTDRWIDGEWQSITEDERRLFLPLHPNARTITQEKLQTLGFNGDFDNLQFAKADEGVELRCRHEQYDGRQVERWDLAGSRAAVKPASADKLAEIRAWWNASASQSQAPTAAPPAPPAGKSATPPPPIQQLATSTREKAWQKLVDAQSKDKTDDELTTMWRGILGRFNKSETDFTADDWAEVESMAATPF